MTRRNPSRQSHLRLVRDARPLQRLAGRIEPTDLDGVLAKMKLVTALGRLRLQQIEAEAANPPRASRV